MGFNTEPHFRRLDITEYYYLYRVRTDQMFELPSRFECAFRPCHYGQLAAVLLLRGWT